MDERPLDLGRDALFERGRRTQREPALEVTDVGVGEPERGGHFAEQVQGLRRLGGAVFSRPQRGVERFECEIQPELLHLQARPLEKTARLRLGSGRRRHEERRRGEKRYPQSEPESHFRYHTTCRVSARSPGCTWMLKVWVSPRAETARTSWRPCGSSTRNSGVVPRSLPSMLMAAYGFESMLK